MNVLTLARAARALSLGVWLGASIMVFIAAPIVFEKLAPDRTKAGEVVGSILHAAAFFTMALAAVALISEGTLFFNADSAGWKRVVPAVTLLLAILIMIVLMAYIGPKIEALREQIGQFTPANADSPERKTFGALHGASMGLSLLQTILVAVALVVVLL